MKCEPVQLIKSSPGKACRVTPHLTVGFSERSDCLSWPSESELVATQDSFPQRLLTVELTGKLGAEEREALHRLKQRAEWIFLDLKGEGLPHEIALEACVEQLQPVKASERKIGVRMLVDSERPMETSVSWITKAAIVLGEPAAIFLDGDSFPHVMEAFRQTQDRLVSHPLSQGAATIIPHCCVPQVLLGDIFVECLDFHSLDRLLIEAMRPFCGGICLRASCPLPAFSLSLESFFSRMVADRTSSASILESWEEGDIPRPFRLSFFQLFFALMTQAASPSGEFEDVWLKIQQSGRGDSVKGLVASLQARCEQMSLPKHSWLRR